jgi:hypothetical protein
MSLKIYHAGAGSWHRLRLPDCDGDGGAWPALAPVAAAVAAHFGLAKFTLHACRAAAAEPEGPALTEHAWRRLALALPLLPGGGGAAAASTLRLLLVPADDGDAPADWVDPFWGSERTSLPQLRGVAAAWYWPKALQGNTHPGACQPFGNISVIAYSGAYPSGYGINGSASEGLPPPALLSMPGGTAFPPDQYTATGFTHYQASGTGSIGNYMNYVKVMPLAMTADGFVAAAPGTSPPGLDGQRCTVVGERAQPGRYSCILGEPNIAAEVTVGDAVAAHRYTFRGPGKAAWNTCPACPPPPPPRPADGSGGGGGGDAGAAAVDELAHWEELSGKCVAVELSAVGLLVPSHGQQMVGITAKISEDGATVSGMLTTPPPVGADGKGLELYYCIFLRGAAKPKFYPASLSSAATLSLEGPQLAALIKAGGVGIVADLSISEDDDERPQPQQAAAAAAAASVELRVGFSLVSVDAATASAAAVAKLGFDQISDGAWRTWNAMLGRVAVGDSGATPGGAREISLFYSNLYHAMKKPYDFTGHVPSEWTVDGKPDSGYVFDLATMWDQYKCLLPLIVSVWPDGPGGHLIEGCVFGRKGGGGGGHKALVGRLCRPGQALARRCHTLPLAPAPIRSLLYLALVIDQSCLPASGPSATAGCWRWQSDSASSRPATRWTPRSPGLPGRRSGWPTTRWATPTTAGWRRPAAGRPRSR